MNKQRILIMAVTLFVVTVGSFIPVRAVTIYGMTQTDSNTNVGVNLVRFDSATPGTVTLIGPFAVGLVNGHAIRTIDFRPSNGVLYAISTNITAPAQGQLYTVNTANAALTPVGAGFTLGTNANARVDMDFNPVVDAIRVVTGGSGVSGQNNFRVNPTTGALVLQDTNLAFAATDDNAGVTGFGVTAIAYSNNFPGAPVTTLYGWEWEISDALLSIGNFNGSPNTPNSGIMNTIAFPPAFLTRGNGIGMDIAGGTCYVVHDDGAAVGTAALFTRNVTTGVQTLVGAFPATSLVYDLAVQLAPTAAEVEVSGRVITSEGRGLSSAIVTLTDSKGNRRVTLTGRRGQFTFNGIESGQSVTISVRSRRFQFAPRIVDLNDSVTDLEFSPIE